MVHSDGANARTAVQIVREFTSLKAMPTTRKLLPKHLNGTTGNGAGSNQALSGARQLS